MLQPHNDPSGRRLCRAREKHAGVVCARRARTTLCSPLRDRTTPRAGERGPRGERGSEPPIHGAAFGTRYAGSATPRAAWRGDADRRIASLRVERPVAEVHGGARKEWRNAVEWTPEWTYVENRGRDRAVELVVRQHGT